MGFAMKMGLRESIVPGTLKNTYEDGKMIGYEFGIQMDYYRGHYLSTIDELSVKVDGEAVPEECITFCLNGKEFGVVQLKDCFTEYWEILQIATLKIWKPGGLSRGEHEIDLRLMSRSPYMPLDVENHVYMPLDHCSCLTMKIQ